MTYAMGLDSLNKQLYQKKTALKCIYSYFLKTHDFLQSILDILAANKHFFKD